MNQFMTGFNIMKLVKELNRKARTEENSYIDKQLK